MRRIVLLTLVLAGGLLCLRAEDDKSAKTLGSIDRKDKGLDDLLAKDAKLEILGEGYNWVEGPVWRQKEGYLLFSDIPSNSVYKYNPGEKSSLSPRPSGYTGKSDEYMEPGSNGLLIDPKGRLILMQHGARCVARLNEDGKTFTKLASHYEGKRLNSPN